MPLLAYIRDLYIYIYIDLYSYRLKYLKLSSYDDQENISLNWKKKTWNTLHCIIIHSKIKIPKHIYDMCGLFYHTQRSINLD